MGDKGKKRRRRIMAGAALGALAAFLLLGLDARLRTVTYEVHSEKITTPVRLAVLTDLHSCSYGEGQGELLDAVAAAQPDGVLLVGDIVDDVLPEENAWAAVSALAAEYPCYYVTGNHEWWSGQAERICQQMAGLGVTVLRGEAAELTVGETVLTLWGIDDPDGGGGQLEQIRIDDTAAYTILLAHRPEEIERYVAQAPFDLVVSGHAHGGQWRLPGLINGLYAPNQGLFPAYAGGRYQVEGTTFLVSRGLARESTPIPRVYNRPELVIVDLLPAG